MQFRISQSDSLMFLKRDILAASFCVPMLQLSKTQCERALFSMRTGARLSKLRSIKKRVFLISLNMVVPCRAVFGFSDGVSGCL